MKKKNNNSYTFSDTTAKTIMAVVESLIHKEGNISYITDYIGATRTYVCRAVNFAVTLDLIIEDRGSGSYKLL